MMEQLRRQAITLGEWVDDFEAREDRCPWPGPRPYRTADRGLLVGREDDIKAFRHAIEGQNLVFLAGRSGVGKSSLTNAAFVPDLRAAGHTVAVCDNWDDLQEDAVGYIANEVVRQIREALPDFAGPSREIFDVLARLVSEGEVSFILVLDQFEELIRYSPKLAAEIEAFVLRLNKYSELRVVISFRSEFLDRVKRLEQGARGFSTTTYLLGDVDGRYAGELMSRAKLADGTPAMEEAAIELVLKEWERARAETAGFSELDPFGKIGFLHLQALLYTLYYRAEEAAEGASQATVTLDTVETFLALAPTPSPASDFFRRGVNQAIVTKIKGCVAAADGVDRFLLEGAKAAIAGAAQHLSSGGYKIAQDAIALADVSMRDAFHALENGIRASGAGTEQGSDGMLPRPRRTHLLHRLLTVSSIRRVDRSDSGAVTSASEYRSLDLYASSTTQIATALDEDRGSDPIEEAGERSWSDRLHADAPPWVADPKDVTNGPMMGRSPVATLIEESRRYAIGMRWLQAASLVRLTKTPGERVMVSLIHDGFGPALIEWAESERRSPVADLHALTRPTGGDFSWEDPDSSKFTEGAAEKPLIFTNLRWRGAWVFANFRHCVFVNCDFRGTYFFRTVFESAHFVNCQLDGAIFDGCHIVGPVEPLTTEDNWYPTSPWFRLEADEELLRSLLRYQESPFDGAKRLLSREPGHPAVPEAPGFQAPDGVPTLDVQLESEGGMLIYGGRLSAMVMRGTRFDRNGTISFRHVAGTGLDIVGSAGGRYEIFGSAIRHATLTADPLAKPADRELSIMLRSVHSRLAQSWVGRGIKGEWEMENCMVTQAFNASDEFVVTTAATSADEENTLSGAVLDGAARDAAGLAAHDYDRMDAQSNPAQYAAAERNQGTSEHQDV
jgi:hypothetical protein